MKNFFLRLVFLMALPLMALAVPNYINYQGRLLDSNGIPITQASMSFVVAIWTASSGGSKLYQENQTVNVDDGVYSFQIGNGTSGSPAWSPATLFNTAGALYMELTVQGQTLSPRMQLLSAPFTLQSGNSDNLGGQPISYFGTAATDTSLQNQIYDLEDTVGNGLIDVCNASATSKWSNNNKLCFGGAPKCKSLDFSGEAFSYVALRNADCRGALFAGTNFTGAVFNAVNFSGSDMSTAVITGVVWGAGTICPSGIAISTKTTSCANYLR